MANQWLRLWHDMPNDPKWRTIARASKQSIPSVIAVYVHILVIASNATERGRTQGVCSEDIASALDLEGEQVEQILSAMQGRVLDGDMVAGWAKRQVEREDGAAERAKAWREAQKQKKTDDLNATERNRTQQERKKTPDTDTDTDIGTNVPVAKADPVPSIPAQTVVEIFHEVLPELPQVKLLTDKRKKSIGSFCRWVLTSKKSNGERRAQTGDEAVNWIRSYFERARDNDFLMGRGARSSGHEGWRCDIDFLLSEKGKLQVIEKTGAAA